jgi:hypothetical protein
MKQILKEELNRLKFLLSYKPGQLMTESQIKRTYLNEQSRSVSQFNIDFSNYPDYPMAQITYNGQKLDFYMGLTADRIEGKQVKRIVTPPTKTKKEKNPEGIETEIAGDSFDPNIVTISNPEAIKTLKNNAISLANTIEGVFNMDPKKGIENVEKFIGKGFNLIGHADGDVPRATTRDTRVLADHNRYGKKGLYGGQTTPLKKNEWLATKRAQLAYKIFYDEFEKLIYDKFGENFNLIDLVLKRFAIGAGYTTLKIVNHLNPDGTENKSEIGPEYRKFEFNPSFNVKVPISTIVVEPGTEKVIETGSKIGIIDLEIEKNFPSKTVEAYQGEDPGIGGNQFIGVTLEDAEKNNIPIVSLRNKTFNGKKDLTGEIVDAVVFVEGLSFGKLNENKFAGFVYYSPGHLCINEDDAIVQEIEGKKYHQVRYLRVNLKR